MRRRSRLRAISHTPPKVFFGRYEISYGFDLPVGSTGDYVQVHRTTELLDSERQNQLAETLG